MRRLEAERRPDAKSEEIAAGTIRNKDPLWPKLTELTPYMEEEAKKDFFPNVMETRMVDGKIYGLPMEVEPMAMYYSVKAFQDVVANLASGFCAMQNVGIWAVSALRENAKDFQYGVFPLPVPPGGTPKSVLGGWSFVANAKGQNPEEAAKFCVWALGSMQEDSVQRVVDWCTKAKSDVSPRKSALDKGAAAGGYSSGPMKIFKDEIFPTGRGEPRRRCTRRSRIRSKPASSVVQILSRQRNKGRRRSTASWPAIQVRPCFDGIGRLAREKSLFGGGRTKAKS